MRAVCVAAVVVCACAAGRSPARGMPLPPVAPGPGDGPALPDGTDVSRPLTPVDPGPVPITPPPGDPVAEKPAAVQRVEEVQQQKVVRRGPLGPGWDTNELLLWWPKAAPIPPLVTSTRSGLPPALGAPGTTLWVGNRALDNPEIAGGRFTLGWAANAAETVGFEIGYFFLGSRTNSGIVSDRGSPRIRALGLPFIDASTGQEAVFTVAAPGVSTGSVFVTTTTRLQGAEGNAVANLIDGKGVKVHAVCGYRFLQVNEGLTVEQMRASFLAGGISGPVYDEFSTSNRFHGGQLGLHADATRGVVFCELTGKVALGQVLGVVRIDGASTLNQALPPPLGVRTLPGGVYALPTNIGRYTRSAFAVVPEGTLKVGVRLGDVGRFYVGYNFLYLSDAVRPGDQIDRTLNPNLIPALNPAGGFAGPDRPRASVAPTDYWVQGLIIGLETRY